jgi:hypothetical protein
VSLPVIQELAAGLPSRSQVTSGACVKTAYTIVKWARCRSWPDVDLALSGDRVGAARPRVLVPMVRVLGMPVTRVLEIEVVFVANALVATGLFDMHMGMFTFVVNAGGRFHCRKPPRSQGLHSSCPRVIDDMETEASRSPSIGRSAGTNIARW